VFRNLCFVPSISVKLSKVIIIIIIIVVVVVVVVVIDAIIIKTKFLIFQKN